MAGVLGIFGERRPGQTAYPITIVQGLWLWDSGSVWLVPVLTVLLAQGLYEECQYLFQPQLIVQRLVNIAVLYPGYVTEQSMAPHNRSCLYK